MQFVYPAFLFALSAVAIPIIIHLFNFRKYKKIYFTNVRFLQEIKQDTKSRSQLKHLLILLSRILAVIFLVLAFAQPYLPMAKAAIVRGLRNVSIYIDNSYSMEAVGKNGSLMEVAKKKARDIAMAYNPSDRFQLLTTDFEGRHQRMVNREELLQMIDEVKPGASVRNLSEVVARQQDALRNLSGSGAESKTLYVLSDFQKTVSGMDELKADSSVTLNLVPMTAAETKNLYIDSCWLSQPFVQLNVPNELNVRIKNISGEDAENIPVKLFINDTQRALGSVNVAANGSAEAKLSFTINQAGWQQAIVSITDYPVTFDDSYYFSFNVKEHLQVLAINEQQPSQFVEALFKGDEYFALKNAGVNQLDYSGFSSNNLIVLNGVKTISSGLAQELKKYLEHGGVVVVFPAADLQADSYRSFLQSVNANIYAQLNEEEQIVSYIETKHPLFSDVFEKKAVPENLDLPVAKKYFTLSRNMQSREEVLMRLQNGNTFLSATPVMSGQLLLSAVPLDAEFSNFPKHALFIPVMLRAAMMNGSELIQPLRIGSNDEFVLSTQGSSGEAVYHLTNPKTKFDVIPEMRVTENKSSIAPHDQVKESGNYSLTSGSATAAIVSFNYDRRESDLSVYSESELKSMADKSGIAHVNLISSSNKELTHAVAEMNEGKKLWKYCIVFSLLFFSAEVMLIRFMKG
jgi:hypothetical protein